MSLQKKFRGVLEPDHTELKWVVVKVPFDVDKAWPKRNRLRVKGTINGFEFRTSLFGVALGGHVLLVNKEMQKMGGVAVGGMAEIVLEPDLEEREAEVPIEVERLLKKDRALKRWYEQFNYSTRKDIEKHIREPKSAESRMKRAEQLVERMMLAMEGERELPPILQVAFLERPEAKVGWQAMTEVQRRGHLLGIFGYKSPESREKRAAKAVEEAVKVARRGR
jgi:uncharacterized protein YdeI (YjbR/CyaY-like superfamily)